MQDRLQDMIYQAIGFSLSVVSERLTILVPFRYLNQEITSLICAGIDGYYLHHTKATFSENFYSICRDLNGFKDILKYLLVHYGLPLVFKSHALNKLHDISKGLFMAAFLYFKFQFFSPEYWLLKQKLIRQDKRTSMGYWFLIFLACLKILQIFYTAPKKTFSTQPAMLVSAPYADSAVPKGICGICRQKWVNPSALTSSGYIFCYTCIRNHLGVFSSCPITNIKSSLRNLRKIHV